VAIRYGRHRGGGPLTTRAPSEPSGPALGDRSCPMLRAGWVGADQRAVFVRGLRDVVDPRGGRPKQRCATDQRGAVVCSPGLRPAAICRGWPGQLP
jgi:hypothetical protein